MHLTPRLVGRGALAIGGALLAVGAFAPAAQADTGPVAYEDEGATRGCAFYGANLLEFKIDAQPVADTDYAVGDSDVEVKPSEDAFPDGFFIHIGDVTAGTNMTVDWEAFVADGDDDGTDPDPFPIDIVLVKASNGGNEYKYDAPGATSDDDLVSPKDSISHVTFCFDAASEGGDDGGEVQATTGSQAPQTEVKGVVVLPQQLPATGDNDASLAIIGTALVLLGGGILLVRRNVKPGS